LFSVFFCELWLSRCCETATAPVTRSCGVAATLLRREAVDSVDNDNQDEAGFASPKKGDLGSHKILIKQRFIENSSIKQLP
jgi:hypothetical protein